MESRRGSIGAEQLRTYLYRRTTMVMGRQIWQCTVVGRGLSYVLPTASRQPWDGVDCRRTYLCPLILTAMGR